MDGAAYSVDASGPAAHQITWELLAQAAAAPASKDGPILLDSARQEAVAFAAACVAQGYEEFLYGASEELRPLRFQLRPQKRTSPATPLLGDAPVSDAAPVSELLEAIKAYKWVWP